MQAHCRTLAIIKLLCSAASKNIPWVHHSFAGTAIPRLVLPLNVKAFVLLFLLEEDRYFPFTLRKPHPLSAELSPLGWLLTVPATLLALDINRLGKGEGGFQQLEVRTAKGTWPGGADDVAWLRISC